MIQYGDGTTSRESVTTDRAEYTVGKRIVDALMAPATSASLQPYYDLPEAGFGENVHSLEVARIRRAVKVRLRALRRLPADHDGEGAAAPIAASVDAAIAFVSHLSTALRYGPTLDDDGRAVIEFEDRGNGIFADITFEADSRTVECYLRKRGAESELEAGALDKAEVRELLSRAGVIA